MNANPATEAVSEALRHNVAGTQATQEAFGPQEQQRLALVVGTMLQGQAKADYARLIVEGQKAGIFRHSGALMPDPVGLGLIAMLGQIEQQAQQTAQNSQQLAEFCRIFRQGFEAGIGVEAGS